MNNQDLIDVAFECVLDYFKNKKPEATISFEEICDAVIKKTKISKTDFDKIIGSFYVDLMQDRRLIYLGNDSWNLKDRIKLDQYLKNLNSLYDYDSSQDVEDGYENMVNIEEESKDIIDDDYNNDDVEENYSLDSEFDPEEEVDLEDDDDSDSMDDKEDINIEE